MQKIHVTIWNEFRHEQTEPRIAAIYPDGIHNAIKQGIAADDLDIRCATLDQEDQGLPDSVINSTDVLIWWGHRAHSEVRDDIVEKIHQRILQGMGLIVLHSGHFSKIFRKVTGTTCSLKWRVADERERLWNIAPAHPITRGIGEFFEIPHEEMYGERFDIPKESEIIFISNFEGGNVFRSGITLERGYGKIFYFQPGHESYPVYYQREVLQVIANAIRWAKPAFFRELSAIRTEPLDKIYSASADE